MNEPFRRNETVRATETLPGVPEGTTGKVKMINGFTWTRYWVFFDNGVELGSLDTAKLVRPQHWDQFRVAREQRIADEAEAAARKAAGIGDEAAGGDASAAAAIDPNDPLAALIAQVPPHLIERSAAARVRLGVPKP